MAERRSSKSRKGTGKTAGYALMLAAVVAVLFVAFPSGGAEEPDEVSSVDRARCGEDANTFLDGVQADVVQCIRDLFGLDPNEGDTLSIYFVWDGTSWDAASDAMGSGLLGTALLAEDGYSAESTVPGEAQFDVQVIDAESNIVFSSTLTRDDGFGFAKVSFIDLPGADTIRIVDSSGKTADFEVA